MIKLTKVGTLKSTGEAVFQTDAGSLRVFKTAAGREIPVNKIDFSDGPVKPDIGTSKTEPVTKSSPEQEIIDLASVAVMEEANARLYE